MSGESLKGHLELLLLSVLQNEPAHGYAIIERLRERSAGEFDLAEGTVYPALHRLEQAGLLASRWSDVNGRRRRVYRITRVGSRELRRSAQSWRSFSNAVNAVIGGAA